MKKLIVTAAAVVILAGTLSPAWSQNTASGQRQVPAAIPHKVGLIDMSRVFKEYKKFDRVREELKQEFTGRESQAKQMAQSIQTIQEQMKQLKEGSPDFLRLETQLAGEATQLQAFGKVTQRDLVRQESQAYKEIYLETVSAVRQFAEYYRYTLVMRFDSEALDSADPQKLIQGLNRQVVYHRNDDDITDAIIKYLNQEFEKKSTAAAPRTGQAPAGTRQN